MTSSFSFELQASVACTTTSSSTSYSSLLDLGLVESAGTSSMLELMDDGRYKCHCARDDGADGDDDTPDRRRR